MVVLITGGASGLGLEISSVFASYGYDIILTYNSSNPDSIKGKIENKYKVKVLPIKCDISNEDDVTRMKNIILEHYKNIDCIVNNVGICSDCLFMDKSIDSFRRVIDVNLVGTFSVCKYIGYLINKGGSIVNVSSDNSIDSYSEYSMDYDSSKAGINILTKNLAREFAPNVRVNAVLPGWIDTPMNKNLDSDMVREIEKNCLLGRIAKPIEVARVIYFLASDDASYVNGSLVVVNGGK